MAVSMSYRIMSWNVRGLNNMAKRHKVFAYLKKRGTQIAMLQETHLTEIEGKALQRRWRGQVFYTSFSAYARGVLIWVRAGVPFQRTSSVIDPKGRYIVIMGRLDGRDVALMNIYAPNTDQGEFLTEISRGLADYLV